MTKEYLQTLFEYRDGVLYNKTDRANSKLKAGEAVGYINKGVRCGYLRMELNGKKYQVHRLVFLMHHGYLPKGIDHKDGDKLNNRIENLRAATHFQNMANVGTPITNKSGFKGVCWHKREGKWRAQINANNKKIHLGSFDNPQDASDAYKKAALIHHKEFANV